MPDNATSADPAVQAQLDRLWRLSPGADILGLERITALLGRLGDPHHRLPPVLHVAGTNGKGSTCAFLRAAVEAAGLRAHVYTSPHLVRFNERIRLAGRLIDDAALTTLLAEVLDQADGLKASFFEVTTAAAFLVFSRTPADACIVEVGLGGRLDATNVLARPAATGIAQLGIDHQAFLGDTLEAIAGEKAGIAKAGVPLVTMRYPDEAGARIAEIARSVGAQLLAAGRGWSYRVEGDRLIVADAAGQISVPLPRMVGSHQPANLALAIAMLRQTGLPVGPDAFAAAATDARWPARMQRLATGPLTELLPRGTAVWLDGGHNPAAGAAIAHALEAVSSTGPRQIIVGMLANKEPDGLLAPLVPLADRLIAVPVPDHAHHDPLALAEVARSLGIRAVGTASDVPTALRQLGDGALHPLPTVLILGSLYLAGEVLRLNGELPD
jgi:dihydrofolate synthase / folylpolyglutamate synthase